MTRITLADDVPPGKASADCYRPRVTGRPAATSHAAIEDAAFRLFAEHGFEATTLDHIASAVGVGRRTLFRYYPSKNDIPWGQFDDSLRWFADALRSGPSTRSLPEAIRDGVIAFNSYPDHTAPQHRARMALLLRTPALLGHSELRYQAWRRVVSEYVAERLAVPADDLRAVVAGRVALAVALSAYEVWLEHPEAVLGELMSEAFDDLGEVLGTVVS